MVRFPFRKYMKFNTGLAKAKENEINTFNVFNVFHARYIYIYTYTHSAFLMLHASKYASTNDISDAVTCELIAHKT